LLIFRYPIQQGAELKYNLSEQLSDILSIQKVNEIQSLIFDDMKKYSDDMTLNDLYNFLIQVFEIVC